MSTPRLNRELSAILYAAMRESQSRRHEFLTLSHLFFALLHDDTTGRILRRCGGDVPELITQTEELLSEAWKESEGSQGEGGGIVPIIGGVVAAVALFAFAQVPVGGNAGLAPSAPPLPTAEQIRAKYAEVGALEAD